VCRVTLFLGTHLRDEGPAAEKPKLPLRDPAIVDDDDG